MDPNILSVIAEKHYTKIPYHNFEHALDVRNYSLKLINRCKKYKIKIDEESIIIAALFHDAGYTEVKENKEKHSCKIVEEELTKLNYSKEKINIVKENIMATAKGEKLKTTEQKILRASDLHNFMASYSKFKEASRKIREEFKILYPGQEFPIKKWTELVESYLEEEIQLTPEHKKDDFHNKARENIKKFLLENK